MNITADLDALIRTTSEDFRAALTAVLDQDVVPARVVLAGSERRRRLAEAAVEDLRAHPWVPAPQLGEQLRFVDDIVRLGEQVEELARTVVLDGVGAPLSASRREHVALLRDAGHRRLRQLLEGPRGPALDPEYRGCGAMLFEIVDHGDHEADVRLSRCCALAGLLLQASRHAMRAA
ncbi:hypothetical protein GCM10027425_12240 [Alteromonas gracilis]